MANINIYYINIHIYLLLMFVAVTKKYTYLYIIMALQFVRKILQTEIRNTLDVMVLYSKGFFFPH